MNIKKYVWNLKFNLVVHCFGFVWYLHFSVYYLNYWILERLNYLEALLRLAYVKDLAGMKH